MAHEGPRHLVLGQKHRLEASRCQEEAGNLEHQGWLCGSSPVKRSASTKSESSMATSASTFVAAHKHQGLGWVWPARKWQRKKLQPHRGRLTMAWVPIVERPTVISVYFAHQGSVYKQFASKTVANDTVMHPYMNYELCHRARVQECTSQQSRA